MGVFDEEKYQTAANRALQFIKDQLDINHFDYSIRWGAIRTFVPAIAMTEAADAAMPSILTVTSPL